MKIWTRLFYKKKHYINVIYVSKYCIYTKSFSFFFRILSSLSLKIFFETVFINYHPTPLMSHDIDWWNFITSVGSIWVWRVFVFRRCHHPQSRRLLHRKTFPFRDPHFWQERKLEKMSRQAVSSRGSRNTNSHSESNHSQLWKRFRKFCEADWHGRKILQICEMEIYGYCLLSD